MLEGLCHCGEHLREALRGASLLPFTVSPASISKFFWALVCVCLFVFGLVCVGVGVFSGFPRFRDQFSSCATVGAVMARTAWKKKKSSNMEGRE